MPTRRGRLPSFSLPCPAYSLANAIVSVIDLIRRISWEGESAKIVSRMMEEASAQSWSRVRADEEGLPCPQEEIFQKDVKDRGHLGGEKDQGGGMTEGTSGAQGQVEGRKPDSMVVHSTGKSGIGISSCRLSSVHL